MTDEDKKLSDLKGALKEARQEFDADYNPKPVVNAHSEGASIGYEFLAYVISGGILGYLIDRFAETAPFGLMICMVFGLIAGVFRANSRTKKAAEKTAKK